MQRLELMATKGLKFKGKKIHISFSEGLVGLVKRSAEPLNLAEASKHPNFKYFSQLGEKIYHSFLGTPYLPQTSAWRFSRAAKATPSIQ